MQTNFYQPSSLAQALEYRAGSNTQILAGGTDLVPALRSGKHSDCSLIDISKLSELRGVQTAGQALRIGACTTFTDLMEADAPDMPYALRQAAASVGSCQIRNRGTIGGNICNANPCADMVPVLTCLNAQVELQHQGQGTAPEVCRMPLEEFIVGYGKTALRSDQLLTAVLVELPDPEERIVFDKIGRRKALAVARINGACRLRRESERIGSIAFVLGAVEECPRRMAEVEQLIAGKPLSAALCLEAGVIAAKSVLAHTGHRHSSDYKLPVIQRFVAALLEKAYQL